MTYSEKLKDPRWQKKRLQILERDAWVCSECYSGVKTLHVHHKYYTPNTEPWDYDESALTTLCEDCHCGASPDEKIVDAYMRIIKALSEAAVTGCNNK